MIVTEDDIRAVLADGPGGEADLFPADATIDEVASALGALANSRGGVVLLGASEDGDLLGIDDVDEAVDRTLQAALSLQPALIIPLPETVELGEKTLIVARVPRGMPNVYGRDGHYMRRDGARNVGLTPAELRRLIVMRGVSDFETDVIPSASLEDIDWKKAQTYVDKLSGIGDKDVQTVLERRGCITYLDGKAYPTNAGILLFGKEPQRYLRGADITAARFAGDTMSDTFSKQDILGTLPDQIRLAETFLADHLRKGVQIGKKMVRDEDYEYPMEAARELVVNAVAHRDYSIRGDGIRLFIFRKHMSVTSPGSLPGPVTVDNIQDERFSRNPVIVQVLADMGFIERLGYGVDRVIALMSQRGLGKPRFTETAGGFRVELYQEKRKRTKRAEDDDDDEVDLDAIELNPRQEIALAYLEEERHSRITNSDLQRLCPDVHPETLRRDLVALVEKRVLAKRGQKRGSYYVLRKRKGKK